MTETTDSRPKTLESGEFAGQPTANRLAGMLASTLVVERSRLFLWLPVLLGTGIGIYFALTFEPPVWSGILAAVSAGLAALLFRRFPIIRYPAIALSMVAAGFALAQARTQMVAAPVLEKRTGPVNIEGRVIHVEPRGNHLRLILDQLDLAGRAAADTPEKVRIRVSAKNSDPLPGDRVRLRAILSPPPPPAAPGAYDFQRRAYFQGLGAVGFAFGPPVILENSGNESVSAGFRLALARVRLAIGERISASLPGEPGAVARALMTGERGKIPGAVMDAIRDSGLAHLLAISGLHIGLIAGIVFFGLRAGFALIPPLALKHPIKKIAAAIAIVGALAYALIAGATVPTQRAFLMIGLVLLAVLLDRRGLSIRTVAMAAMIILIVQPESLLGASFQLSFAAVIGLVAVYEWFGRPEAGGTHHWVRGNGRLRRPLGYLAGIAASTLIAGAVTAPFAVFHFNRLAAYGLIANLGAVPLTALWIMPWAVVAFLLMPFGLEALALIPMGWGISAVIAIAETTASWPGAVTLQPAMPVTGLIAIVLGGLWLFLWRLPWRLAGLLPIALGFATLATVEPPDILVDDRGELLAVRLADGRMAFSGLRRGRFDREVWLRRAGQEEKPLLWPEEGESAGGRLACDGLGCIYRTDGPTVALVRGEGALLEDCHAADAVIAAVPVRRPCPSAGLVIDRFDLWRHGAHALWIERAGIRVESVNERRGSRPWVPER
ncbi:MAG: ComEC family competence protein [Rhodospirillales bacterium]|nr:ComEC family competence protein [Rhodospirillales bacterium]